jgi:hypothetical protein
MNTGGAGVIELHVDFGIDRFDNRGMSGLFSRRSKSPVFAPIRTPPSSDRVPESGRSREPPVLTRFRRSRL